MSADRTLDLLTRQIRQWTGGSWVEDPASRLWEKAGRMEHERRLRLAILDRLRSGVDLLRQRVADAEERETLLTSWVQTHLRVADPENAFYHAMELDRLRGQLEQDRGGLHLAEKIYENSLASVGRLERRLDDLRSQIERQTI